jgi:hypothetical protein
MTQAKKMIPQSALSMGQSSCDARTKCCQLLSLIATKYVILVHSYAFTPSFYIALMIESGTIFVSLFAKQL